MAGIVTIGRSTLRVTGAMPQRDDRALGVLDDREGAGSGDFHRLLDHGAAGRPDLVQIGIQIVALTK